MEQQDYGRAQTGDMIEMLTPSYARGAGVPVGTHGLVMGFQDCEAPCAPARCGKYMVVTWNNGVITGRGIMTGGCFNHSHADNAGTSWKQKYRVVARRKA